jgi:hypothetical protein
VKKRRRATKKPYSRSIVGATLEIIQKKRAEKPEVRDAAREAALRYASFPSIKLPLLQFGGGKDNKTSCVSIKKKDPSSVCQEWSQKIVFGRAMINMNLVDLYPLELNRILLHQKKDKHHKITK